MNVQPHIFENPKSKSIRSSVVEKRNLDWIDYEFNKTRYVFNEPYQLIVRRKIGKDVPFWYCIEDENLGIDIMEESLKEAIAVFYSEIDFLWRRYAIEKNEKLSAGAIILKNKVNKLIREAKKYDVKNKKH